MKELRHLTQYRLTLTAVGPVFVGDGRQLTKSEYYYDAPRGLVVIPDQARLFDWILRRGAEDRYEGFVLSGRSNLRDFLQGERVTPEELGELELYRVDPGNALTGNRPLQNLSLFRRDVQNRPYIPGSSLKGALRTLLLQRLLRQSPWQRPVDLEGRAPAREIEDALLSSDGRSGALHSRMRGVLVSDSVPLQNSDLVLCAKEDRAPNGRESVLNLVRECLRPGTRVSFALTVDRRFWPGDFGALLEQSLRDSWDWYCQKYLSRFPGAPDVHRLRQEGPILFVGGGSGYFSKSIAYYAAPWDRVVAGMAGSRKYAVRNRRDVEVGIFPHMLKYTTCQGQKQLLGACRLTVE